MNPDSLTVLTYNIHKGFDTLNRRFVLHDIKQAVSSTGADIVFLQEVYGEETQLSRQHADWPLRSQFEFIADSIWKHHTYGKNAVYQSGHHGNAILSRYPIITADNINVSLFKQASRSLLHAEVDVPGIEQPLHLICVHLGLFGFERRRQLKTLIQRIESHIPEEAPLIISGDFNDWLLRARHHLNDEKGISEVFHSQQGRHARSFPAWMPLLKMDRIYSRGLDIVHYQQLRGQPWSRLSDHTPLLAEFSLAS